jgi:aryl-alcohol dehydrogenase-like predicted oxidoreductase
MHYTTLGRTGLRVSVAGLGAGGFSRLGRRAGKSEDEAARLIEEAYALGINVFDTAASYGTEGVVGKALRSIPRDKVVLSTKSQFHRGSKWWPPARVVASLDNSLRLMGADYIDVFYLHGVRPDEYDYALATIAPALLKEKEKGKIRHIGLTEFSETDINHSVLARAAADSVWDVLMVAFHMLHQTARATVFPLTRQNGIGACAMFVVRSIFADPARVRREVRALADKGLIDAGQIDLDDPLGFLLHASGAASLTEAADRFARYEPGVDVVLFGTGDAAHLRTNVAALLKPPLPAADREKLVSLFGHLTAGIGLDGHQPAAAAAS